MVRCACRCRGDPHGTPLRVSLSICDGSLLERLVEEEITGGRRMGEFMYLREKRKFAYLDHDLSSLCLFALSFSRLVFGGSCIVVTPDLTTATRQLVGCLP
jgi:hypothetical protein